MRQDEPNWRHFRPNTGAWGGMPKLATHVLGAVGAMIVLYFYLKMQVSTATNSKHKMRANTTLIGTGVALTPSILIDSLESTNHA